MGSRHNRKRTRSRPRNRNRAVLSPALSFDSITTPPPLPQLRPIHAPFNHLSGPSWQQSFAVWHDSAWLTQQRANTSSPCSVASTTPMVSHAHPHHSKYADEKHLRVFGGEPEDGMALCDSMVQVVLDLFGSVDYDDDIF